MNIFFVRWVQKLAKIDSSVLADMDQFIKEWCMKNDLRVGDRKVPIPVALTPRIISDQVLYRLCWSYQQILKALDQLVERAFSEKGQFYQMMEKSFTDDQAWQVMLTNQEKGSRVRRQWRRTDMLGVDEKFNSIELNAQATEGWWYHHKLCQLYTMLLPKMFSKLNDLCFPSVLNRILQSLVSAYIDQRGFVEQPTIGIIYWREDAEVPGRELPNIAEYFRRTGYKVVLGCHDELSAANSSMYLQGNKIDVLWRNISIGTQSWNQYYAENPDLIKVLSQPENFVVVPAPHFSLAALKCWYGVLSDPAYSYLFTGQQRQAVHDLIPWSRIVNKENTQILNDKSTKLLKKTVSSSGKGVLCGWQTTDEVWQEWLRQGVVEGTMLVQKATLNSSLLWPVLAGGKIELVKRITDLNLHIFDDGEMPGSGIVRFGKEHPINVAQKGGMTIIVRQSQFKPFL